MKDKNTILGSIAISRKNLVELVLIVILLAFGINLISSQLFSWLSEKSLTIFIIGVVLCLTPIFYALGGFFNGRRKKISFIASVAYNPIEKELISIKRYEFSEAIARYIEAAFSENPALKTRWEKQPLEPYTFIRKRDDDIEEKASREVLSKIRIPLDGNLKTIFPKDWDNGNFSMTFMSMLAKENATIDLLTQAAEYFLLEKFSSHLYGYFNDERFSWKYLTEYTRKDIPSILLNNIFLEIFSRPMSERSAFVDHAHKDRDIGLSFADGGPTYRNFLMILPKGSTVKRPREHEIEIETKKLKIRFAARFGGGMEHISFDFLLYYLGCTNLLEVAMYRADIEISVSVKLGAMFSNTGWEYYHWVDSFLEKIEQSASQNDFVDKIDWESTLTSIECTRNILTLIQKSNLEDEEENSEIIIKTNEE